MAPWCLRPCPRWQSWGTHVNLCSFCAYPGPDVDLFLTTFPRRLSGCMSLALMLLLCSLAFLLLLVLSCPLVSWPGSFCCFFPLFECWRHGWPVLWYWAVTTTILAGGRPCFVMPLVWLGIKAEEGYWRWYEPFQYANYVMVQMTFYQYNRVLSYSFLSLPVQYVKL